MMFALYRSILVAIATALFAGAGYAQTNSRKPATSHSVRPTPTDSLTAPATKGSLTPRRQRFWFSNNVMNVYDSNIAHDSTNMGSHGIVVGANGRFRTASSGPAFQLEYGVAMHSYTATDRWDRVSHIARAGLDIPVGKKLLLGVVGEAALKGSSEDREIGDHFAVLPRIELRPVDNVRLRVSGAYRQRDYGEGSGSNAVNRYANVDMRWRFRNGAFNAAARFEENLPDRSRNRFTRHTYSSKWTWLLGDRDELLMGLEYRPVRYPERMVDVIITPLVRGCLQRALQPDRACRLQQEDGEEEEIEVPRRDERWKPGVGWVREWGRRFRTALEYEYEARSSNDPVKRYRGHVITFTTGVRW